MIRLFTVALAAFLYVAPAFAAPVTAKAPEGAKQPAAHFDHAKHGIKQTGDKKAPDCAKCHDAVAAVTAGDMKPTNPAHSVCLNCHKTDEKAKALEAENKAAELDITQAHSKQIDELEAKKVCEKHQLSRIKETRGEGATGRAAREGRCDTVL
jgi:cytochrome c553